MSWVARMLGYGPVDRVADAKLDLSIAVEKNRLASVKNVTLLRDLVRKPEVVKLQEKAA